MSKKSILGRAKAAVKVLSGAADMPFNIKQINGAQFITGQASFSAVNPHFFAQDGYNANAIAFYCINLVAAGCANVPLKVYRKKVVDGDYVYECDTEHELNKFLRQPRKGTSGYDFQFAMHAFQLITGNCYMLSRFRNVLNQPIGQPYEWDLLRPDRVSVTENNGELKGYRYSKPAGGNVDYPINPVTGASSVLHLKDFHPLNDFYGMSPLEPASKQVDISNQAARFNKALLDNGARLTVALHVSQNLTDEEVTNIKNQFVDTYSGAMNAGRSIVLENIERIDELGVNPRDMEFSEGQLNAFRLIANAMGVPTYMLGLRDTQSTFNNMQEARTFFYMTTISQRLKQFYGDMEGYAEGTINLYLQQVYGDENICIKPDWDKVDALSSVREKRYERAKSMTGIATIDEQRKVIGLQPLEIAGVTDIPWRPVGEAPITFSPVDEQTQEEAEKNYTQGGADDAMPSDYSDIEFKLINDQTPEARQRELAIFDRLLTAHERKFTQQMANMIDSQARKAAHEYEQKGGQAQIAAIFENDYPKTLEIYTKQYRTVMEFFGKRVIEAFSAKGVLLHEYKDTVSLFDLAVRRFLQLYAAKEVRLQSDTTKGMIRAAILQGEVNGKNRREIAKEIVKAAGGAVARRRAAVIAATETHSAANYAQREAGKVAAGDDSVEWVSAEDGRVRPTHSAADGQVIRDGEKFVVGDSRADYPGDPTLPAKERVRCRCTTAFVVDELSERSDSTELNKKEQKDKDISKSNVKNDEK